MGHTMQMAVISGAMLALLVIAGLANPALTFYPSKDALGIASLNIGIQADGGVLDLGSILSGGETHHKQ